MDNTFNSGPIPGANYTSNTKNYPWRQPPEFSDIDTALDYLSKRITKFDTANGILNMAEAEIPLYKIAQVILMLGMSEGKWTMDYALLLVGPLTRMIELICIGYEVDYKIGIEEEDDFNTSEFFKQENSLKSPDNNIIEILSEEMPEIKQAASEQASSESQAKEPDLQMQGFMSMTNTSKSDNSKEKE